MSLLILLVEQFHLKLSYIYILMKATYKIVIFCGIIMILSSCFGGNDIKIDSELQEYVDRFIAEGEARGQYYEDRIGEINISLAEIFTNGVLGQCVSIEEGTDAIQIDKSYWQETSTSDLEKEFVMFHELGHCVLLRGHLNNADGSGICSSIMYDGNSTACMLEYFEENREELIDELFQ